MKTKDAPETVESEPQPDLKLMDEPQTNIKLPATFGEFRLHERTSVKNKGEKMDARINREMLNRQLNRLYDHKIDQLNKSLIDDDGVMNQTISTIGFIAAIEHVLIMINTLPWDAQ
jgi:hypothetical protein